jgi:hypothetical protein
MRRDLIALFADPRRAEQAVRDVAALGVENIHLASPASFSVVHRVYRPGTERHLGWFALGGAAVGLAAGVSLQVVTSLSHPMIVGGKPIVAWPAFAIICFELTMLGAGLSNFLAMAVLSAWARRNVPHAAKEAVASDCLAVVVPIQGRSASAVHAIEQALAGAEELLP